MTRAQLVGVIFLLTAGVYLFMKISQTGLDKIKRHEGLRLYPYKDEAGHWTIGYGHKLLPGEWYDKINEQQAEDLLRQDLAIAESAVNDLVKVPLSQNQYDALVSFVYNVGVNAFRESTLLRKLNAGDYTGAAAEFPRWKYAGGKVSSILVRRRAREQDLFVA